MTLATIASILSLHAPDLLLLLLNASVKGAAVLIAAGFLTLCWRGASASTRHLIWLSAVTLVLLMPVLSTVLPAWSILPQWSAISVPAAPAASGSQPRAEPHAPISQAWAPSPEFSPFPLEQGRRKGPALSRQPADVIATAPPAVFPAGGRAGGAALTHSRSSC